MRFYFRTEVLNELTTLWGQARVSSKMMVIMGRRRVGKTSLAMEFVKDKKFLYLFAAKKAEALLCKDYVEVIERELNIKVHGKIETFKEIFSLLMEHAKTHHFVLIIDEFQEFLNINPSVYSDLQCIWDLNKNTTKMQLIFIGSIYTLMHKIFEDSNEPLFGRADRMFTLQPFTIPQMQKILKDYQITDLKTLFDFYVISGGVPKYLDLLLNNNCKTLDDMLDFMVQD
ncbi:MAG: AAA family ATPase, partial [Pseudomonadota bacterium]|nr:AAA family ATPase [Pseudomonadota bacterium]